jgi:hypothetical protein
VLKDVSEGALRARSCRQSEGLEQESPEEQYAQYQGKRDNDDLDHAHD